MPTHFAGTEEQRAALDAYIKLWRAAHAVEARANRHLLTHGLTISQFAVLEAVYHLGPLSQRQLAAKILRSSGNLTMVIDNLERAGHVRRERQARDRRVVTVSLTPGGRALVEKLLPTHVAGIQSAFAALDAEELAAFARLSRKLGLSLMEEQ